MMRTVVRGAMAGLAGAAVMTVAQQLEMSRTGRAPSTVPGQVAAALLGRSEPDAVTKLNLPMHWAHGVAMGPLRAALAKAGVRGPAGSAAFLAMMWAGDVLLYRALEIADWPWRWSADELAADIGHKALYAFVTGAAYDALAASGR